MEESDAQRMLPFTGLALAALLLAVILFFLAARLFRYKLDRIKELLGHNVRHHR